MIDPQLGRLVGIGVPRQRHQATVSDAVSPVGRAPVVGVYRFWRDMGYAAGGLLAGVLADAIDFGGAIALIAGLTALSGVWVALDLPPRPALKPVRDPLQAP